MTVTLRLRRPSDEAFVVALSDEAFGEYAPDAGRRARREPGSWTLVAEADGEPVGFATLRLDQAAVAHLDAIAVEVAWRGRGVGRRLLLSATQDARRRGARRLSLITADSNLAALDLFRKCGFSVVRSIDRFYPRGQRAHVLELALEE